MIIKHKRFSDETKGWVDCDGNAVDIGTMVAPHRHLCVKCRKVFTGYAVDADTNEVVGYVDEEGGIGLADAVAKYRANHPTVEQVGRIRRLWKAFLRWLW